MFPPTIIGILSNIIGAAIMGAGSGAIAGFFGDAVSSGVISGAVAGAVIGGIFGFSPTTADGPRVDLFSGWGYGGFMGGVVGGFMTSSSWWGGFVSAGVGWTLGMAIPAIFMALMMSRFKP